MSNGCFHKFVKMGKESALLFSDYKKNCMICLYHIKEIVSMLPSVCAVIIIHHRRRQHVVRTTVTVFC